MRPRISGWPFWAPIAAGVWSAIYAGLGVYWAAGGPGFPFGLEADPAADVSILWWIDSEIGAAVLAGLSAIGVVVALLMATRRVARPLSTVLVWFAWCAAVVLAVLVPDFRILAFVAYLPVALIGPLLGLVSPAEVAEALTWPMVNQFLCVLGGFLWALAALSYQRSSSGRCVGCGRGDEPVAWTEPEAAARWGRWATYAAMVIPALYSITRLAWAAGVPLGITEEFLEEGQETGLWRIGAALGTLGLLGALLTWGLIRPWGEVFPRWFPFIGGRRVPPALAIVPASIVAVLVTGAGLMYVRLVLSGRLGITEVLALDLGENWATIAPELLWPLWGLALAAATYAYYLRRRGICRRCGRGARPASLRDEVERAERR
jgi:hypothetical protein